LRRFYGFSIKIDLDGRIVDLYICGMIKTKSIRINEEIHSKFKVYCARAKVDISKAAEQSMLNLMKEFTASELAAFPRKSKTKA
jgi:hypothetical protein